MGYVRPATVYKLIFEDGDELAGLEVRVRSMTTGQLMDLTKAAGRLTGLSGGQVQLDDLTGDDLAALDLLFGGFAAALVEWNLEENTGGGSPRPVPATLEGIRTQESPFILRLVTEWMKAAGGTPAPLAGRSTSGETPPGLSIPMEPLSPSLSS